MRPEAAARPSARDLIREALAARLREVGELLGAVTPGGGTTDAVAGHGGVAGGAVPAEPRRSTSLGGPEDSLRRLMVSVVPGVRQRPAPGADRTQFFMLLADLENMARSDDLRFLDAWNNAFEIMASWPAEEISRPDAREALRLYAALLGFHLRRLEGRA